MLRSRYMTPFPPCTSFVWDNVPEKVTPSAHLAAAAATSGGLECQGHRRGPHYESNKEPQSPRGERSIRAMRVMRCGMVVPPCWLVLSVERLEHVYSTQCSDGPPCRCRHACVKRTRRFYTTFTVGRGR